MCCTLQPLIGLKVSKIATDHPRCPALGLFYPDLSSGRGESGPSRWLSTSKLKLDVSGNSTGRTKEYLFCHGQPKSLRRLWVSRDSVAHT